MLPKVGSFRNVLFKKQPTFSIKNKYLEFGRYPIGSKVATYFVIIIIDMSKRKYIILNQ
jgi:hypothetical protein